MGAAALVAARHECERPLDGTDIESGDFSTAFEEVVRLRIVIARALAVESPGAIAAATKNKGPRSPTRSADARAVPTRPSTVQSRSTPKHGGRHHHLSEVRRKRRELYLEKTARRDKSIAEEGMEDPSSTPPSPAVAAALSAASPAAPPLDETLEALMRRLGLGSEHNAELRLLGADTAEHLCWLQEDDLPPSFAPLHVRRLMSEVERLRAVRAL